MDVDCTQFVDQNESVINLNNQSDTGMARGWFSSMNKEIH